MSAEISRHERFVYPVLAAMVVTAWIGLAVSDGAHLAHGLGAAGSGHADHGVPARTLQGLQPLLFVGSWVLMTIAMMMPSTLPVVDVFRRLTRMRADRIALVALLLVGYLAAWTGLGIIVFGASELVRGWLGPRFLSRGESIGVLLFVVAGAFQLTSLKDRCLTECRTPIGFVVRRWNGKQPRRASLRTGLAHGVFCVGCCWALMLLMFAFNVASLVWMLGLGLVMGIEKNAPWGRKIVRPLGYTLLGIGFAILILSGQAPG